MSAQLKDLLSKDVIISRNIGEDATVLSEEDRFDKIRELIMEKNNFILYKKLNYKENSQLI